VLFEGGNVAKGPNNAISDTEDLKLLSTYHKPQEAQFAGFDATSAACAQRMDYYRRYSEIVADYNREKDRVTLEETFAKLVDLMNSMDAEQRRATEEGLSEDELALFDLLKKPVLGRAERERVKLASKSLLESVTKLIQPLDHWTKKEQTKAMVEAEILDHLFQVLPTPSFTDDEKQEVARKVYQHVWQQSAAGHFGAGEAAA